MFRCESDAPCLSHISKMPGGSRLNDGKWACTDGPQRAFDPRLLSFCIEGLCTAAHTCLADVEAAATKSWTCGIKTGLGCQAGDSTTTSSPCKLLFNRITATDANSSNTDFCRAKEKLEATNNKLVLAGLIGTAFALCVGMMIWLVRRKPAKVKKSTHKRIQFESYLVIIVLLLFRIFFSMMRKEFRMILKVVFEGFDFATGDSSPNGPSAEIWSPAMIWIEKKSSRVLQTLYCCSNTCS